MFCLKRYYLLAEEFILMPLIHEFYLINEPNLEIIFD